MAVIELSAQLTGAAESMATAGLRMGLEATIRRPKPSDNFAAPVPPPQGDGAVLRPYPGQQTGVK